MKELNPDEIQHLIKVLAESEHIPRPIVPQLEGLIFWYLPKAGDSPAELMQWAMRECAAEGGTAGDYVALSKPLLVEQILERWLTPVGDEARQALGTWLELHYNVITSASMDANLAKGDPYMTALGLDNVHPIDEQEADTAYLEHMNNVQAVVELLNKLLPEVGIFAPVIIVDGAATEIEAGPLRLRLVADGWQVMRVDDEERAHERHMDRMLAAFGLLNAVLPTLGITAKVMIEPILGEAILIGNVRVEPGPSGWTSRIDTDIPVEFDLTIPDGVAGDWNEVLDAALAARGNWRASASLAVIAAASNIGTPAAHAFIAGYSDDQSPSQDETVRDLAEALHRLPEWEAAA